MATKRVVYSPDLFAAESLTFVEQHRREPFFLYLALTAPARQRRGHASPQADGMEVPDDKPYSDRNWPQVEEEQGGDDHADGWRRRPPAWTKLKALGLDERTIVFFTSDNGPHHEGGVDPEVLPAPAARCAASSAICMKGASACR